MIDWIEVSVVTDGEAAEAVTELFNRLNSRPDGQGGAVTEIGGFDPIGEEHDTFITVKTYLPAGDSDTPEKQRQIEEGIWFLGRIYPLHDRPDGTPALSVKILAEEDWANAWKTSYQPLRVGERFLIIPAWQTEEVTVEPSDWPIILDPGMAFGTGLHPSTQLCLIAMESVVGPGMRVLDAGCGSGILSIAAARAGASVVDAFDIDPIAMKATVSNAALNELPIAIRADVSAGPGEGSFWAPVDGSLPQWDVILVNILPHVIIGLLNSGLHHSLAPGGRMILAGIILDREPEVRESLELHGIEVIDRHAQGDWVGLVAARAR